MDLSEKEKIKMLLKNIHPECSEKELETMAINLWEISLVLIRLQIKNDIEKIDGKIINIIPKCNSP